MKIICLALAFLFLLCYASNTYPRIRSCEEARETGIYTLKFNDWAVDVICDMETDGGGWLVILNRRGGYEDFYRPQDIYKDFGVGSPQTEYFLPLLFLHEYLSSDAFELLEEMTQESEYAWAMYSYLALGSEEEKFSLKIGAYDSASTSGGDNWNIQRNMQFTTYDEDNDCRQGVNCASVHHTAGWFFIALLLILLETTTITKILNGYIFMESEEKRVQFWFWINLLKLR